MEEKKHSEHKKSDTITMEKATLWKIIAGVLALAVILLLINGNSNTAPPAAAAQGNQDPFPTVNLDMSKLVNDDPALGSATAPITIVEFSDYQCPFCKQFYTQTEAQLKAKYIDTGKVRFVYRDFPLTSLHQNANIAALAADCANEQGKFWEFHDILFTKGNGDGSGLDAASLKQYAADLKLDTAKFNACLDSAKYQAEVQNDAQDGSGAGVQGTPGFFIGKTGGKSARFVAGAYPFSSFQQLIDAMQ